jgi:hypothetical protein
MFFSECALRGGTTGARREGAGGGRLSASDSATNAVQNPASFFEHDIAKKPVGLAHPLQAVHGQLIIDHISAGVLAIEPAELEYQEAFESAAEHHPAWWAIASQVPTELGQREV